jgi:hypothetical protein
MSIEGGLHLSLAKTLVGILIASTEASTTIKFTLNWLCGDFQGRLITVGLALDAIEMLTRIMSDIVHTY